MRLLLGTILATITIACSPQTGKQNNVSLPINDKASKPVPVAPADRVNIDKKSYKEAPEALKAWVTARAGTGKPVHWIAEGGVYAYPSGEKLFGMIGFDSSTVKWPDDPKDKVLHLTRKTFAYTDKDTGEILTTFNGNPVEPIAYPYQMIHYRFENGRIYGDVEQGVGENIRNIKSSDGTAHQMMGDTHYYNASVFLDFPLPSGAQYEAWENYDFFIHPKGSVERPFQMSWQRYGKLPKWAGDDYVITTLLSWRVDSHAEFPESILEWGKAEKPMWLNPPKSVKEVRDLQKGQGGPGWSE